MPSSIVRNENRSSPRYHARVVKQFLKEKSPRVEVAIIFTKSMRWETTPNEKCTEGPTKTPTGQSFLQSEQKAKLTFRTAKLQR